MKPIMKNLLIATSTVSLAFGLNVANAALPVQEHVIVIAVTTPDATEKSLPYGAVNLAVVVDEEGRSCTDPRRTKGGLKDKHASVDQDQDEFKLINRPKIVTEAVRLEANLQHALELKVEHSNTDGKKSDKATLSYKVTF